MKIIKNQKELAITKLRQDLVDMLEFGINGVHPATLMNQSMLYSDDFNSVTVNTNEFTMLRGRIFVVGGGKGAGEMAVTLEKIIGPEHISAGIVNCISDDYKTKVIKVNKAGHPLPDRRGVSGVKEMLKLKDKYNIKDNDLVICLISGGASALLPGPVKAISLRDKQKTTDLLINCGAGISDINIVRKHLSTVKGGHLAKLFAPAIFVSIIISDVIGDRLEVIGSGPGVPDDSTFDDALAVLDKQALTKLVPESVLNYLRSGVDGQKEETPKELKNAYNYIIGNNAQALESVSLRAKQLGYKPIIASTEMSGTPEEASRDIAEKIKKGDYNEYDLVLFGGETTPSLSLKPGLGGRNQHFAAASILALADFPGEWAMASLGTDGVDYTDKAAGAIIDNSTAEHCRRKELNIENYLHDFDTYHLFKKLGNSLIDTGGYTGTNVRDVVVYLRKKL
jgi:glycerate 2-kinase